MTTQVFILEVESETDLAVLTARLRLELGLFIGKDAYTLSNAEVAYWDQWDYAEGNQPEHYWFTKGVPQYLGCDPKTARHSSPVPHQPDLKSVY